MLLMPVSDKTAARAGAALFAIKSGAKKRPEKRLNPFKSKRVQLSNQEQKTGLKQGGFTLVEVMVALSITAIALVAGLKAAAALTDNAERQSRVLLGQICAENALIELKLTRQFPGAGDSALTCAQAGQTFDVTLAARATPNPNFRRVEAIVRQQGVTVVQVSTLIGRY